MDQGKRRHIRWKKKLRVAYSLMQDDESYREVFTEDISESGLQIISSDRLSSKQMIRLRLEFVYDSVPIVAVAKVVYVGELENRFRVGLEFLKIDSFQEERLKRYLGKLRQDLGDETD
jgi:c-di-GMP-binding flagellar brake protein YcgR